ncbi:hybrid sensor histidine kinase/response regulator [Cognatilysobacter bugurensis]|uniref:histidine kinase n=1 Tax=Cognatilysobacter bugurensis TaxID=543356 RepID=A0A918SUQ2_9GAMM|nr:hybrid sensor histidine kinase/response regulator [Lysobacter bugurensis]GHA68479.1 hypothetical protein GCM10007067_00400 [Lysobacter bugurensis]
MTSPLQLLLVDDNPDDRALVLREIRKVLPEARVDEIGDAETFDALLEAGRCWDVVVTDYRLRWSTGLDIFARLRADRPGTPVIMFTASGDEELAVSALKQGVDDYITKTPKHYGRVPYAVQAVAEHARRTRESDQAQQALERTQTLLKLALEAGSMDTWEYDLVQRRLALHGRSPRLLGGQRRELASDRLHQLLHDDDRERVTAEFLAAASGATRFESEFRIATDGSLRWLRAAGITDGATRMVGIVEDVTRRKRVEEQLREADREKDRFIATLGHELRNPLAPIRYAARLLDEHAEPARVVQARDVIERQAATMAKLLDQLLDLTRIRLGRIELERAPLDLRTLLHEACEDARLIADAGGQRMGLRVPDAPAVIDGDALRLRQAVDNLLHNALKFTPPDGRVDLELAVEADAAIVRVRDTGVGIEADMLERVFDSLVQVQTGPGSTTRGGLGIGLAVVRWLIELHGGTVEATSAGLGSGTTFTLTLPLAHAAPEVTPEVTGFERAPRALRIVVADDQADAAYSLGLVLEMHGHEVRTALDGLQAQAIADAWQPDAMVLDIGMPGATGDAIASWAREQPWGEQVRLVAVTGWGRPEDRVRLREAGFNVHLVKPVAVDDLLAALDGSRE